MNSKNFGAYNSKPIGFFDSGIGGLSVYSCFMDKLNTENTLYLADLKNLPYGNKTPDELIGLMRNILDFFEEQEVKALIIACNTMSANAYEKLKDEYDFKIYPILQIGSKMISKFNYKRIGVFATQATVNTGAYGKNLTANNSDTIVKEIACPKWVDFVECDELSTHEAKQDISSKLNEMLEFHPDKVILGCTHYPFMLNYLQNDLISEDLFLNPAKIFVDYVISDLKKYDILNDSGEKVTNKFYVTDKPEIFIKNSGKFCSLTQLPEVIDIKTPTLNLI